MSRLIVKGLPGTFTESKLRTLFGECGTITDCSLKYTKEGKFRRFAFVGFESEEEAAKARHRFHNTFVNASRIQVEECKPFGDETKPRAWSKYAKESSAYKRLHPTEAVKSKGGEDFSSQPPKKPKVEDARFREFLQVQNNVQEKGSVETVEDESDKPNKESLLEELLSGISGNTSLSIVLQGMPSSIKQKSIKEWFSPIRLKGIKIVRNSNGAAAFVTLTQKGDVRKALQRNGQFLGGFKIEVTEVPISSGNKKNGKDEELADTLFEDRKAENEFVTNAILETGRLFLRNLPYSCTEDDIQFLAKKFGEVAEVEVIIDKKTKQCKGFAIVTYVFPENAVAAYSALDGTIFKGRMLHVIPGEEKKSKNEVTEESGAKSVFQKQKSAKLKMNAGKAHSWNALFLGANAVADTLAAKLGVEKSDLLSGEGETSAGVRLTLAETRLVCETREFLLSHGVCLDAFSRPAAKRSNTVIIVKNLPAAVEVSEIERMFGRFGPVKKALMPPGGVSAIIEMENSVDAKKAFNALAYARFRSQPLFLEWAPVDVFIADSKEKASDSKEEVREEKSDTATESVVNKRGTDLSKEEKKLLRKSKKHRELEEKIKKEFEESLEQTKENLQGVPGNNAGETVMEMDKVKVEKDDKEIDGKMSDEEDKRELEPGTTVFVKNLSFSTTDETLRKKFASKYEIRSAVVSKKRDPKDASKSLSMGFGFVQFFRAKDAQNAIKEMQGLLLDGHCLELKLSNRDETADDSRKRKTVDRLEQGDSTKILIRNIPFQASRKEVKQLFSTFGELRGFRMPKKAGSSSEGHRGFGFVDYLTRGDAKRAFDALVHSSHLYGRRLVLEWAKSDDTIEELREKALSNFRTDKKEMRKQKKLMQKIEKDLTVIDDD